MGTGFPESFPVQQRKTSKLAIASFYLGISTVPLFFIVLPAHVILAAILSFIPSIAALVFGAAAIARIRKSHNLKGVGLAVAGMAGASLAIAGVVCLSLLMIGLSHY